MVEKISEAHFSRRPLRTASSSSRCAAGQSASVMAVSAYICSFFFRICSYCALRAWYCFTLQQPCTDTWAFQRPHPEQAALAAAW